MKKIYSQSRTKHTSQRWPPWHDRTPPFSEIFFSTYFLFRREKCWRRRGKKPTLSRRRKKWPTTWTLEGLFLIFFTWFRRHGERWQSFYISLVLLWFIYLLLLHFSWKHIHKLKHKRENGRAKYRKMAAGSGGGTAFICIESRRNRQKGQRWPTMALISSR